MISREEKTKTKKYILKKTKKNIYLKITTIRIAKIISNEQYKMYLALYILQKNIMCKMLTF